MRVPEFVSPDQDGVMHTPKQYRGKWLLLYFYPKDNTPGCSKEACALRDAWGDLKENEVAVLGVSIQSASSHQKFREKYQLPFPLIVDEKKRVVKMFGAWGKKKMMGREYMGTYRMSFLINPQGKVEKVYDAVIPVEHAGEVLRDVKGFSK